jgi:thiol-disulfide isomerase/thioredoxin
MISRKIVSFIVTFLTFLLISTFAYAGDKAATIPKLIVFFSPGCHKCIEAKNQMMPEIEKEFSGRIDIEYRDVDDIENYKYLLALRERYDKEIGIDLPVFFFEGKFLNGKEEIKESLRTLINQSLKLPGREKQIPAIDLIARFKNLKPFAIVSAGLTDGINPCAFTVIVFFISFLALQGYRKRDLIVIGLSFIFSVFFTYLLLGVGLFNFLYRIKGFWVITKILNISIGSFSIVLGILAIFDFFKYKKTKDTEGLFLQLPQAVKNQIHSVIGEHYRKSKDPDSKFQKQHIFRLLIGALMTGFLVSLLEAVCTGQLYLPTIAFVLKTTTLKLQAMGYLLLYNFMFIIPLLAIFVLALFGVTSGQFAKLLKKHLLAIKVLMALVFFAFGLFLIWRA